MPVRDEKVVDKFLRELDDAAVIGPAVQSRGGWIPFDYDFYSVPLPGPTPAPLLRIRDR